MEGRKRQSEAKNSSQPGAREYLVILLFVGCLVYAIMPLTQCLIGGVWVSDFHSFESAAWKSNEKSRPGMLYDLLFWRKLNGLSKEQVAGLLGTPDGPYSKLSRGLLPDRDDYMISGSVGGCTYLSVNYGSDRRVSHVSVLELSPF